MGGFGQTDVIAQYEPSITGRKLNKVQKHRGWNLEDTEQQQLPAMTGAFSKVEEVNKQ